MMVMMVMMLVIAALLFSVTRMVGQYHRVVKSIDVSGAAAAVPLNQTVAASS